MFCREMSFPINFGSPLLDPPCDIRTLAVELTENLEWSYNFARETIGYGHRKAETRYYELIVEKLYSLGSLVRVIQHTHPTGVPSNLNPKYSGFYEVLEVRGTLC